MQAWVLMLLAILPSLLAAQIKIDTTFSSTEIVNDVLLGKRIVAKNIRYAGSKLAMAAFTDSSATPLIGRGILLSTGKVFDVAGPNRRANTTYSLGTRGDYALETISKGKTYDAAWLEFDFMPEMETVIFNFVFGSEEYTEYVNTQFNDVFAFFISGPGYKGVKNLAVVPRNNAPITVNSVNHLYNRSNYIDNNPYDRLGNLQKDRVPFLYPDLLQMYEYDGFTTLLTAEARVKPGQVYHIKISIADVGDGRYDSAVFLEGGSFTSLPLDPTKRAEILAAEYGDRKRKFSPVQVGQDPTELATTSAPTPVVPATSGTTTNTPGWPIMVHFAFDSDELSAHEKTRLDSAWTHVISKSTRKLTLRGHTDGIGNEDYNDQLSARRVQAVIAYLQTKGLPSKRIAQETYGQHKPIQSNATDKGRAVNRRVEIAWENEGK